jgi:hypothetical protein
MSTQKLDEMLARQKRYLTLDWIVATLLLLAVLAATAAVVVHTPNFAPPVPLETAPVDVETLVALDTLPA